jgi:hypothetical protein
MSFMLLGYRNKLHRVNTTVHMWNSHGSHYEHHYLLYKRTIIALTTNTENMNNQYIQEVLLNLPAQEMNKICTHRPTKLNLFIPTNVIIWRQCDKHKIILHNSVPLLFQRNIVWNISANDHVILYVKKCNIWKECANVCHLNRLGLCVISKLTSRKNRNKTHIYFTHLCKKNSSFQLWASDLQTDVWAACHL